MRLMERRSALQDTADELAATKLEVDAALAACDEEITQAERDGEGQNAEEAAAELEKLLQEKAKINKAIEAKKREVEQRARRGGETTDKDA